MFLSIRYKLLQTQGFKLLFTQLFSLINKKNLIKTGKGFENEAIVYRVLKFGGIQKVI